MTGRHVSPVCSSSSVSQGSKQRSCPWVEVSQCVLASTGMLRAALRSCSTVHLIHKWLPLQQMPLQCAAVGFGSLEETTAGFAESRQSIGVCGLSAVCQFSSSPSLDAEGFECGPSCHGYELLGISPRGVRSGEHPSLSLEVHTKDPLAICKVWEVTIKPLQGGFAVRIYPRAGVQRCEPPNPAAPGRRGHAVALFANPL